MRIRNPSNEPPSIMSGEVSIQHKTDEHVMLKNTVTCISVNLCYPSASSRYGYNSMNRIRSFFLAGIAALPWLTGCASAPTAVEATVPLVHSSLAYSLERDAIIAPSSATTVGQYVQLGDSSFIIDSAYISATGSECRRLRLQTDNSSHNDERVMCQRRGQWVMLQPLVKSIESL